MIEISINGIKKYLKCFFIEYILMNPADRKRLKKWYGKKYWRHNKEYNAFWNKFEIMNLLLGGIALIVSCFIYRKFHSIHIISRTIQDFVSKETTIINNTLETGSVIKLILNWNFDNDTILIVGVLIVGVSSLTINVDNYLPEVALLINIIKFSFFILLLESIQIYSMASIFTNVMILMISQNIYIIFRDIFNWVTKKENVRMDYKRLSVLIGIVVAIYSLIK